jgi:hypothetical protein
MKVFSLKRKLIAFTFLLACVFNTSSTTSAAPKIEWTPGELNVTLGDVSSKLFFASFTSSTPLDQVTLEVVPALRDFVTIDPATLNGVPAGAPQTVALHFSLPAGVEPGTFEGVVHVRSGKRTLPQHLKITITVVEEEQILMGTDLPTTNSFAEFAVISSQSLAQGFTLTSPVHINTLRLQMSGFGFDQFTLWLTNSIGPGTTPANVLFQTNLTFPNTGGGISGATVSVPVDLDLAPGNYFIVLSSTQTDIGEGWMLSNTILPSTVGSVGAWESTFPGNNNPAFPPSSIFTVIPAVNPGAFQLLGFVE